MSRASIVGPLESVGPRSTQVAGHAGLELRFPLEILGGKTRCTPARNVDDDRREMRRERDDDALCLWRLPFFVGPPVRPRSARLPTWSWRRRRRQLRRRRRRRLPRAGDGLVWRLRIPARCFLSSPVAILSSRFVCSPLPHRSTGSFPLIAFVSLASRSGAPLQFLCASRNAGALPPPRGRAFRHRFARQKRGAFRSCVTSPVHSRDRRDGHTFRRADGAARSKWRTESGRRTQEPRFYSRRSFLLLLSLQKWCRLRSAGSCSVTIGQVTFIHARLAFHSFIASLGVSVCV